MAAASKGLLSSFEGHHLLPITDVVAVPQHDAVLTSSEDKSIICWLKRDGGKYWPSFTHAHASPVTCLSFDLTTQILFAGLESGEIKRYDVAADFNSMTEVKTFPAHNARVNSILIDTAGDRVFSVGRDRRLVMSSLSQARQLFAVNCGGAAICVQADLPSNVVFVGDSDGNIHRVEVVGEKMTSTILKGHRGAVTCLLWCATKKFLFSGGTDSSVILWDMSSAEKVHYTLHGHKARVKSLIFHEGKGTLLSLGEDNKIFEWNLTASRKQAPEWTDEPVCELCGSPFFWNLKAMWQKKEFALNRQHHCRRCGKSVCDTCSPQSSALPIMGFEWPERMCKVCLPDITEEQRQPLATMYPFVCAIHTLQFLPDTRTLAINTRHSIQFWSLDTLLGQTVEQPGAGAAISRSADSRQSDRRVGRTIRPQKHEDAKPEQSLVQSILEGE